MTNMLKELFDYPLVWNSLVFDVGGYQGLWTEQLIDSLGFSPPTYIFEPVTSRLPAIKERFKNNFQVVPLGFGLGKSDQRTAFALAGDATGAWSSSPNIEPVLIQDIWGIMKNWGIENIDLISVNCEGGEYDILERMIETGIVKNFKYIQVQYHNLFPEASERRDKIREALTLTHTEKYNIPWAWEAWTRL